jgi:hypothetical protein
MCEQDLKTIIILAFPEDMESLSPAIAPAV